MKKNTFSTKELFHFLISVHGIIKDISAYKIYSSAQSHLALRYNIGVRPHLQCKVKGLINAYHGCDRSEFQLHHLHFAVELLN